MLDRASLIPAAACSRRCNALPQPVSHCDAPADDIVNFPFEISAVIRNGISILRRQAAATSALSTKAALSERFA